MTSEERRSLLQVLEQSRDSLVRTIDGLDGETWTRKAPGQWSICEIVEHLNILETAIPQIAIPRFLNQPAVAETHPEKDDALAALTRDRTKKREAPERVCPKGDGATPDQEITRFCDLRSKTIEYVRTTADDLRHHVGDHPVLGTLDCYQWLLALASHTERHILQIEEMKTEDIKAPSAVIN